MSKKEKKRKLRPFARRLTRRIAITQFIVMAVASYLIYVIVSGFVKSEELDLYKSYLVSTNLSVSRVLTEVSTGTINHVPEIEESLEQPDRLSEIMRRIVTQNPHIHSCGISFVADYYPQKGHWYCPYAVRGENDKVELHNIGDSHQDYLNAKWFTEALKAEKDYWSKPFYGEGDSLRPQVSYMVPIHNKSGKTVAILGADLLLDWFEDNILKGMNYKGDSLKVYIHDHSGKDSSSNVSIEDDWRNVFQLATYKFIIDSDGTFIAHPNAKRVIRDNYFKLATETTDTIDDNMGHRMVAGGSGSYYDEDGEISPFSFFGIDFLSVYMFYEHVEHTDWSIALAVPRLLVDFVGVGVGIAMLILIGIALIVVRIVGSMVIKHITKPLKQLAETANEVAKGNFNASLPQIKYEDEVRLLRDSFEGMQHSLTQYIEELKSTTASKAAIENELKVAHDIQMSMLPKTFPPYPERSDIDIFGMLKPAKDVGGDLFDFYISNEQLFFCIGDVSGKGVPASLVMAVTRSLFRNISAHLAAPNLIVSTLNTALTEGNETNMFVTLFVGVLDLATGRLIYCNAGHDAPLLISQDVSTIACDPNLPIGVISGQDYSMQETMLPPGSTIFLFTDGLNEAEDVDHDQFGDQRINDIATAQLAKGQVTPDTLIDAMTQAVHAFVGEAEQSDDLTMLAIQYHGSDNIKK